MAIYGQEPPMRQSNSEQRSSEQSKTELHNNSVYGYSKWVYHERLVKSCDKRYFTTWEVYFDLLGWL